MASPNTLATVNPNLIATQLAEELTVKFPMLAKFSVNYTENIPDVLGYGGSFVVKNIQLPQTSLYVPGVGYTQQTASLTDTTITFNKARGSKLGFNSNEFSSPVVQKYMDNFVERATTALGRDITADLVSVVSNTNFSFSQSFASSSVLAGTGVGRNALIKAGQILDAQGVVDNNRVVVVNHSYYAGLSGDQTLYAPLFGGGNLDNALNFSINKIDPTVMPSTYDGTNNLVGFACHPSAIAFASILPVDPSKLVGVAGANVEYGTAISEASGLQVVVARWFDANTETLYILPKVLYGFAVGVPQALVSWISPSAL